MTGKKRVSSIVIGAALPVLVLLIWHIFGVKGRLNEALLPSLTTTVKKAVELIADGSLLENIFVSLGRVMKGFAIGASLGIVIGVLMGLFRPIYKFLNPTVAFLRSIPMMALIPLFILWLGIGESCKVALIALGSFWSVLLNTIHGVQSVDPKLVEVTTVLEKKPLTVLTRVYLPSALPAIITGLRLGMGTAWACVVAAEMMAASKGVGYMIMFARELSQPDKLMVGIFSVGVIGLLIDQIMLFIQRRVLWWNSDKQTAAKKKSRFLHTRPVKQETAREGRSTVHILSETRENGETIENRKRRMETAKP